MFSVTVTGDDLDELIARLAAVHARLSTTTGAPPARAGAPSSSGPGPARREHTAEDDAQDEADHDLDEQILGVLAHGAFAKADAIAMVIGADRAAVLRRLRAMKARGRVKQAGPYGWQQA